MTFSTVSVTKAYSMTGEPPPSHLCPTTAPLDPDRTDPRQAGDPGDACAPPLPSRPATMRGTGDPPSPSPTSARARARARTPTQPAQTPHRAVTLVATDAPPPTAPPMAAAGGIEAEYARISRIITTALDGGDARPCHSQARSVLDVHRISSAQRRGATALLPAARVRLRYRALTLLLHPDRAAPELLRHRTMARLAWDAVQTAHAYLEHTDQVDGRFPLGSRRPPATPFTGLWVPVPHADSAAFLAALPHTPTTLVPTRPRGLPIRLARTSSLTLARPAHAPGLGTPAPSPPIPDSNTNVMSRSHSLPNRVPPPWHDATPLVLDFPRGVHGELDGTTGQPPRGPQYRPLLLHPTMHAAPPPQHNLDLALNDSDARFIASRLVPTVAPIVAVDTPADQLTDQESLDDSDDDNGEHMSSGDDETRVGLGVATRRPSIGTTPPQPASLLGMHDATQPAQATPLSETQSTTAGTPLPPPELDPRAHIPMHAHEDCAGSSGDMGPHTQAPSLVRLTTDGDSSPFGPPDAHTGTRVAPPAPPVEHQRQHTSPPPVAPPRDSAGGEGGAAPRALLPISPRLSWRDIAQQWTATAGPARPADPLASRGARPEQAAPLRAARSDTAPAPLAPVLDPGAHGPARAQGDDADSSGDSDSQAQAPALLRLTTGDAPSPLGAVRNERRRSLAPA